MSLYLYRTEQVGLLVALYVAGMTVSGVLYVILHFITKLFQSDVMKFGVLIAPMVLSLGFIVYTLSTEWIYRNFIILVVHLLIASSISLIVVCGFKKYRR